MTPENYNDDDLDLMGYDYTELHSNPILLE